MIIDSLLYSIVFLLFIVLREKMKELKMKKIASWQKVSPWLTWQNFFLGLNMKIIQELKKLYRAIPTCRLHSMILPLHKSHFLRASIRKPENPANCSPEFPSLFFVIILFLPFLDTEQSHNYFEGPTFLRPKLFSPLLQENWVRKINLCNSPLYLLN